MSSEYDVFDNFVYCVYYKVFEWLFGYRVVVIVFLIIVFIGIFVVFVRSNVGVEFFLGLIVE